MPGYFASNALASFSATGRSTDVYHATLPSLRAASISAGVVADGSGAAASGAARPPSARPAETFRTSRLENVFAPTVDPPRLVLSVDFLQMRLSPPAPAAGRPAATARRPRPARYSGRPV